MVDGRQVLEQVRLVNHIAHVVAGIAHEHHGCLCRHLLDAAAKALVGHVILHDVNDVGLGLLVLAGNSSNATQSQ